MASNFRRVLSNMADRTSNAASALKITQNMLDIFTRLKKIIAA